MGQAATSHVRVRMPAAESNADLPVQCVVPPGVVGNTDLAFFVKYYVDDAILAEVRFTSDAERCLLASASFASDHFRLLGERHEGDPPILSVAKVSDWHTVAVVLGWERDTVQSTIRPPTTKLHNLRDLLDAWYPTRVRANVTEVRSLVGKLLHVSQVVRPGKFFVRRMLHF